MFFSFLEETNQSNRLSTALNIVLLEFRSRQFGDLPIPSDQTDSDGDELIFVSNDQLLVESKRIRDHMSNSKRTPDIVATFTSTLRQAFQDRKGLRFEDWATLNAERGISKALSPGLKWTDVYLTWDLNLSGVSVFSEKPSEPCLSRLQNGLKRPSDEEEQGQRKRARMSSQSETERRPSQITDGRGNLLPELRCAYYATERLSAGWHISHSMAVLLEGESP